MNDRYDAIIVGAGHNGMVCGSLLAKAGKKVLILEAAAQVGGAAVTRSLQTDIRSQPALTCFTSFNPRCGKNWDCRSSSLRMTWRQLRYPGTAIT